MPSPDDHDEKADGAMDTSKQDDATVDVDLDESKAQLIKNGGASGEHPSDNYKVKIVDGSSDEVAFNGLGKDEVMKYANDPFWVRLRWILFILFWVGWFVMILTAILIIVFAPRCPPRPDLKWYQTNTVYHAYAKSFKDTNDDGYGDFDGVKDKMDYVTDDLGAESMFLDSIFLTEGTRTDSDLALVDHKAFDPRFGATEVKFRNWLKDLRKKGKQVIVDLIPNQTSRNHTWFKESAANNATYKDYYIWAGSDASSPPNSLKNMKGEPAWQFDSTRKQWYLTQFSSDLPELNLNNEDVQKAIEDIMKFWFDAGVGGFRIQNVEYLVESTKVGDAGVDASKVQNFTGTLEFLARLRDIADSYSDKPGRERVLYGTVLNADHNRTLALYGSGDNKALHIVVPVMKDIGQNCNATCVKSWIENYIDDGHDQWLGLQLSGDGVERVGSRVASLKDIKMAHALQFFLPGTPFNYYGDEIAMKDNAQLQMPDAARTPMQWSNQANAGFSAPTVTPWLAVSEGYQQDNVKMNRAHYKDHSVLRVAELMIELRGKESFQWGKTKACVIGDLLMFTRKAEGFPYYLVIINMGTEATIAPFPNLKCVDSKDKGTVMFHSTGKGVDHVLDLETSIYLEPSDVIVLEFSADD